MNERVKQSALVLIITITSVVLFGSSFLFWKERFQESFHQYYAPALMASLHSPPQKAESPIILMFVGDIMLDRGVEWEIQKNGDDWTWPFHHIAEIIQQADLAFGNLESQISDKGTNVGSIYSFRADPKSIEGLTYAGFDILSVANNHRFDYTREAFEDSISRLSKAGITPVADSLVIKETKGVSIGFLAYQEWGMPQGFEEQIRRAKTQTDLLFVSLHAGEEYQKQPSATQKTLAKAAIGAGADLVVGHHPHVLQPLEQYKNGWIVYSLGNFVFDQYFSEETMQGAVLKVVIQDKQIKEATLHKTKLNSSFQVEIIP